MVLETNMTEIIARIEDQSKLEKQEVGVSVSLMMIHHHLVKLDVYGSQSSMVV